MGDYTISDLLNNIPGGPIRVRDPAAVNPIRSGGLDFDVLAAMETVDMAGEKRTGIMRFGQGMKADTLHETAKGALEQAALMMKRVRMVARIMAEGGVKELALGLHRIMRMHSTHAFKLRRNKEFIPLDPAEWGDRQDMSIEIGIGSGGRQEKIEHRKMLGDAMGSAIQYQQSGGLQGTIVTAENAFAYYEGLAKDLGFKSPEKYFSDPANAGQSELPPEIQQALQQAQEQMQALQQENEQLKGKQQTEVMKIEAKAQADRYKSDMEAALQQQQMRMEAFLKQQQMQMEAVLKRYGMEMDTEVKREANANMQDVEFGGKVG